MDTTQPAITTAEALSTALNTLKNHGIRIQARMDDLRDLGMTTSKPVYREGKYLTLVAPMTNGTRARQYVGSDPDKIAAALARIDRQEEYNTLADHLQEIKSNFAYIEAKLTDLLKTVQHLNKKHATSGHPPKRSE